MTDNGNTIPEVDDYVAYNWSGQIATGYIVRKSKDGRHFSIEQALPEKQKGHISRIRGGPRCLLVLDRKED
jgi:hypothetical protein